MLDTEVITPQHWERYAGRVARETMQRHGVSWTAREIAQRTRHMIVHDRGATLLVRRGWTRVMRAEATRDLVRSTTRPPTPLPGMPPIGPQLRTARERLGLSQAALARAAGLAREHVSRIEDGQKPNPFVASVWKLAQVLGVSMDVLCGRRETPAPHDGKETR